MQHYISYIFFQGPRMHPSGILPQVKKKKTPKNSSFCLECVQKHAQGTATSSLNSATFDRLSEGCDLNAQFCPQKGMMESCGDKKKQNKGLAWLSN